MPSFLPTPLFDKGWCSALGMAAVLTLSTAPLVASPSAAVELEPAAIDETVFPIGAPPAMIEATEGGKPGARLWRDDAPALLPDAISTGAISTSAIMATPPLFRFATSPLALAADRHILVGLMLLAVAAMASVSFRSVALAGPWLPSCGRGSVGGRERPCRVNPPPVPRSRPRPGEQGGFLSGLNPLETLVIAAIILVALGGALLVGKGLLLKSRVDAATATPAPLMLAELAR